MRGCAAQLSSPTCKPYSQPLESRVQLHVYGVQRLQVLPVLYVSVKKEEKLSQGVSEHISAQAGQHSIVPHTSSHLASAKTFNLQKVWGLDILSLQHPYPQTYVVCIMLPK